MIMVTAVEILPWFAAVVWLPAALGALLAIGAFGPGPYGYRGRHGRRRAGLTLAVVPSSCTPAEQVWITRARIDARATAAELMRAEPEPVDDVEVDDPETIEVLAWIANLQPPEGLHPELHRYEQAAGSRAYIEAPRAPAERFAPVAVRERDARITTQEMVLRFGEELAPVLALPAADEWHGC